MLWTFPLDALHHAFLLPRNRSRDLGHNVVCILAYGGGTAGGPTQNHGIFRKESFRPVSRRSDNGRDNLAHRGRGDRANDRQWRSRSPRSRFGLLMFRDRDMSACCLATRWGETWGRSAPPCLDPFVDLRLYRFGCRVRLAKIDSEVVPEAALAVIGFSERWKGVAFRRLDVMPIGQTSCWLRSSERCPRSAH